MRELSLFTGAGGGLLGTMLLGWTPVGYVEWNDYAQRIIRQRIDDGILPNAPIFGDIQTFISDGYAASYTGLVDVVTGGFPCQPFSVAGKQLAADDPRNMWPATIDTIRMVRPRFAFLENVPSLLNTGYFSRILGDLAESGYDARWRILSAAEMGAPHKRDRLWIVAYTEGTGLKARGSNGTGNAKRAQRITHSIDQAVSAYANGERRKGRGAQTVQGKRALPWGENIRSHEDILRRSDIPKPLICGMDDGMAAKVDRLKAIGNGQVPIVAATAWNLLTCDLI